MRNNVSDNFEYNRLSSGELLSSDRQAVSSGSSHLVLRVVAEGVKLTKNCTLHYDFMSSL